MLQIIEQLLVLQDRDKALARILQALAHAPQERKLFESRKSATSAALEAAKEAMRANEVERKNLETEAGRHGEQVLKFKTQQQATRKNEEFSALANEIHHFEEKIRDLDDRQLELMEAGVALAEKVKVAASEFATVELEVNKLLADLDVRVANLEARKHELETERTKLTEGVDEEELDNYGRIFRKKGEAVVPVIAGVCGGCHMKVSNATIGDSMVGKEIVFCDKCGRIVYFVE